MRRLLLGLMIGFFSVSMLSCSSREQLTPAEWFFDYLEKLESLIVQYGGRDDIEVTPIEINSDGWYQKTAFEDVSVNQMTMAKYPHQNVGQWMNIWRDKMSDWNACIVFDQYDKTIRAENTAHITENEACRHDFSLMIRLISGGGLLIRYERGAGRIVMKVSYDSDGALTIRFASYNAEVRPFLDGDYRYVEYVEGKYFEEVTRFGSKVIYSKNDLDQGDSLVMIINDGVLGWHAWYDATTRTYMTKQTYDDVDHSSITYYNEDSTMLDISWFETTNDDPRIQFIVNLIEVEGWNRAYLPDVPNGTEETRAIFIDDQLVLEENCLETNPGCYGFQVRLDIAQLELMFWLNTTTITDSDLNLTTIGLRIEDDRFNLDALNTKKEAFFELFEALPEFDQMVQVSLGKRTFPAYVDRLMYW